ncbi:hypothetical protein FIBSPDRAFT_982975 [Athelia psychrophila]|uniref:Uncharacterized protein n=1 Tax=Athelia psychrophila TaxID=1759441 RepID=A0A166C9A3_9AGAM|nr:hypothetical protein FIBSPDRAFT_982975 [Fibularhizoctonia sp. CBS 109695]
MYGIIITQVGDRLRAEVRGERQHKPISRERGSADTYWALAAGESAIKDSAGPRAHKIHRTYQSPTTPDDCSIVRSHGQTVANDGRVPGIVAANLQQLGVHAIACSVPASMACSTPRADHASHGADQDPTIDANAATPSHTISASSATKMSRG